MKRALSHPFRSNEMVLSGTKQSAQDSTANRFHIGIGTLYLCLKLNAFSNIPHIQVEVFGWVENYYYLHQEEVGSFESGTLEYNQRSMSTASAYLGFCVDFV
jgi:hypothetical protein